MRTHAHNALPGTSVALERTVPGNTFQSRAVEDIGPDITGNARVLRRAGDAPRGKCCHAKARRRSTLRPTS